MFAVGGFCDVWIFGLLVPPGSGRDGREWELGKCAMFCWRLWTEGLKEQLCRESQHPVLYCTSPVIIEVIIEVVFWPLKPAVLSESHSAQCVVLCFAGPRKSTAFFLCLYTIPSLHHQKLIHQTVILPLHPYLWSRGQGNFAKISWQVLFNLAKKKKTN